MTGRIILLDLNYTLVDMPPQTRPHPDMQHRLRTEEYRGWLVELVRPHYTILVTARPDRHRDATLARILELTGWAPQEAFFNDLNIPPAPLKERILTERIFPVHGFDRGRYLGVESNPKTRAMYARYGIRSHPVPEGGSWASLP